MAQRLFGTDGVRGKAGEFPLDHETVARLGAALVRAMRGDGRQLRFIVGRDTRESGEWIERELARGVAVRGRAITSAGVAADTRRRLRHPRDGLRRRHRDLGVAQSVRGQRHQGVLRARREVHRDARARGRSDRRRHELAASAVPRTCRSNAPTSSTPTSRTRAWRCRIRSGSDGMQIAIDTRERRDDDGGAAAVPRAGLRRRGPERHAGRPQHQPGLRLDASRRAWRARSSSGGCRLGVAFDGDGDRAILVDAAGRLVDGDAVLLMCGRHMQATGQLDRQRHRRDRDEQHRSRARARATAASSWCAARSATST